jgi:transposase
MRKNFDGLSELVRTGLGGDPLSGHLFVFRNKRGDHLKLLYWDIDGLAVWANKTPGLFCLFGPSMFDCIR